MQHNLQALVCTLVACTQRGKLVVDFILVSSLIVQMYETQASDNFSLLLCVIACDRHHRAALLLLEKNSQPNVASVLLSWLPACPGSLDGCLCLSSVPGV